MKILCCSKCGTQISSEEKKVVSKQAKVFLDNERISIIANNNETTDEVCDYYKNISLECKGCYSISEVEDEPYIDSVIETLIANGKAIWIDYKEA